MSQYRYNVGFAKKPGLLKPDTNIFNGDYKGLFDCMLSDEPKNRITRAEDVAEKQEREYVFYGYYEYTTCRESLIYGLDNIVCSKSFVKSPYGYPVAYATDWDESFTIDDTWLGLILKMAKIYFHKDPDAEFDIHIRNFSPRNHKKIRRPVISFYIPEQRAERAFTLAKMSYIFWLFRNPEIMRFLVGYAEKNPEVGSLKDIMNILTVEFLEHQTWGNGSNSNLGLSLFSFHCINYPGKYKADNVVSGPEAYTESVIPDVSIRAYVDFISSTIYKGFDSIPMASLNTRYLNEDLKYALQKEFARAYARNLKAQTAGK